jgi:pimeloyl-ACP methyl ester carboxylesterase
MRVILACLFFLIAWPAHAEKSVGSVYISGGDSKVGLILCHGRGKHPTWQVVNPLRKHANKKLGIHTLSLQMPNQNIDFEDYASAFPQAYSIIEDGIRFLKEEKNINKIFLMGHSMGARMASSFVAETKNQSISGLIVAGCRNNGEHPLACDDNLEKVTIPVLDIWGNEDIDDVESAAHREKFLSKTYSQIAIANASHKFKGGKNEFLSATIKWLQAH